MKLSFLLWLTSMLPQPAADHVCLATTVYLEARSESKVGQMAVAEVAMRRRESGRWGRTVCDVVRSPGQFATTTMRNDTLIANPVAWKTAVEGWSSGSTCGSRPGSVSSTPMMSVNVNFSVPFVRLDVPPFRLIATEYFM